MEYKFGWVCPKCGRVYRPDVSECSACNQDPSAAESKPVEKKKEYVKDTEFQSLIQKGMETGELGLSYTYTRNGDVHELTLNTGEDIYDFGIDDKGIYWETDERIKERMEEAAEKIKAKGTDWDKIWEKLFVDLP